MALQKRQTTNSGNQLGSDQQIMITPSFSGGRAGFDIYNPALERQKLALKSSFPSAGEKKELREERQVKSRIDNLIDIFSSAQPVVENRTLTGQIAKSFPEFKKTGLFPKISGTEANLRASSGLYKQSEGNEPGFEDVGAYNDLAEGFVTTLARRAGEQRVSDLDAKRFRRSLMQFYKPGRQNELLKQQLLQDSQILSSGQFLSKYTGNPIYEAEELKKVGKNRMTAFDAYESEEQGFPEGVTEEQIAFTMKKYKMSRNAVLDKLRTARG